MFLFFLKDGRNKARPGCRARSGHASRSLQAGSLQAGVPRPTSTTLLAAASSALAARVVRTVPRNSWLVHSIRCSAAEIASPPPSKRGDAEEDALLRMAQVATDVGIDSESERNNASVGQKRKRVRSVGSDAETSSDEAGAVPQPPAVFPNLGNTCYISTTVQALLHTPTTGDPLTAARLLSPRVADGSSQQVQGFVDGLCCQQQFRCFVDGLRKLGTEQPGGAMPLDYTANGRQQDAHLFLVDLLECISKPDAHLLFQGKSCTQSTCKGCGNKFEEDGDTFQTIQLPVKKEDRDRPGDKLGSLADAITNWVSGDHPDRKCQTCNYVGHTTQRHISALPENLVLCLLRYITSAKLSHEVTVDADLHRKEFADAHYVLYAGVIHKGDSVREGHYVAYIRTKDGCVFPVFERPDALWRSGDCVCNSRG